jgi:hypothetical protein
MIALYFAVAGIALPTAVVLFTLGVRWGTKHSDGYAVVPTIAGATLVVMALFALGNVIAHALDAPAAPAPIVEPQVERE